jgi:peptidoglycan/xylan/chitin deacetylase (PgdA/CDA1 family)
LSDRPRRFLVLLLALYALWLTSYAWYDIWQRQYSQVNYEFHSRLTLHDWLTFGRKPKPVGVVPGDPLERLGLSVADLQPPAAAQVKLVGKTRYLNGARAVVSHSIDDANQQMAACLDSLDRYGVKTTAFIDIGHVDSELWARLRKAIADGHEIGSHSRRHQCQRPENALFCFRAYSDWEVTGSREDILAQTGQPYVWSWAYPCGSCAERSFVQNKLANAGYLVARSYPGESEGIANLPNLRTWAANPMSAAYTQVVQKRGGTAKQPRMDVPTVNKVFDDVYAEGGIYQFVSHPAWLEYRPEQFYEQHLAHIGGRPDVWYVPLGPLYAYHTVQERTDVRPLSLREGRERFAVTNDLDPTVFGTSVTVEFEAPPEWQVRRGDEALAERPAAPTTRWNEEFVRRDGRKVFVTVRAGTVIEFSPRS